MHPSQYNQLHAYGTGASSNSANSSPMKRAPPAAVSPLASPMESRRLFMPPTSAKPSVSSSTEHSMLNAIQLGYTLAGPQPAKLLIDPQTGQQYFVPTTPQPMSYYAAPAPLFYPNQFYSTPAPNATTAQTHSGFMFANPNQPPTTLWSPQQLNSANPSHHHRPRALSPSSAVTSVPIHSSGPDNHQQSQNLASYHVEVPLSSVGSVCEEAEFVQYQQHAQQSFQRQHQIRQSTESRGSIRSFGENNRQETHVNQRDPISSTDRFSPSHASPNPTHNQSVPPRQILQLQSDHHSTGGSSSESTSGFASGRDRLRAEEISDGRSPPQSPLLRKERCLFPPIQREEVNTLRAQSPKSPSLPKPLPQRMKAIRMDIDLNRPVSPPEREQQLSVRTTVLRTAPPTAFTISFNESSPATVLPSLSDPLCESVGDSRDFSLQEAARQAPTGRRLMATRRSVPPRPMPEKGERIGATDSGSEAGDPKRWLFRKMMMGRDQRAKDTEEGGGNEEGSADDMDDMVSETGTYVVESKKMDQSRPTTNAVSPRGCRSGNSAPPSSCSSSSSDSSSSLTPSPIPADGEAASAVKRSLMSDLRRLREQKKESSVPPKTKAFPPRVSTSHQLPVGQSRPCRQSISSSNSTKRTENNTFSRSDGGRFSMRGTHNQPTKGQPKASAAMGAVQQQSPEMVAWLRRKEYDPRKAAAAADQSQREAQQRQQQDSFMACRSFSTSANAKTPFARWRQNRKGQQTMADQRSNRSHDDLSRLGESMDDESLHGVAVDPCSNSLQRTVDELTQKCHKSIELLKLCNQSGLSSSVEQLLEKVVEGSAGEAQVHFGTADSGGKANNENISDRLERLSSAFDAIQKYLEEQTTMSSSRVSLAALTGGKMATTNDVKKQTQGNKEQ
ncbi:hypothetical protein niasHS_010928 [Heterodera schachtii]|uniref:Uncharacterized protein n=1 Tax=Heterodera schachtii TaxID=97005 RepID=A0ABD2J044_HETSC